MRCAKSSLHHRRSAIARQASSSKLAMGSRGLVSATAWPAPVWAMRHTPKCFPCRKIFACVLPEAVDFEAGAFGTLGAIALQGVRLAEPTLGELIVVMGLGLVGQLTAQLLRANGCRVFAIDLDRDRIELARRLGAEAGGQPNAEIKEAVLNWTRGRGADAVVITTASESNQPVELAGEISRLKGRVIVVGTTGLEIPRQSYYPRELSFKLSMSYGPGATIRITRSAATITRLLMCVGLKIETSKPSGAGGPTAHSNRTVDQSSV